MGRAGVASTREKFRSDEEAGHSEPEGQRAINKLEMDGERKAENFASVMVGVKQNAVKGDRGEKTEEETVHKMAELEAKRMPTRGGLLAWLQSNSDSSSVLQYQ